MNDGLRIKDVLFLDTLFFAGWRIGRHSCVTASIARILRAESRCIESEILKRYEEEFQSADLDTIQISKRIDPMLSFIFYGSGQNFR